MGKKRKRQPMREFFTQAERKKLFGKYGKVTKRLNSNTKRAFDACCLCCNPCIQPMVSPYGFLYCKECILKHLIEQKKRIKKKQKEEKLLGAQGIKDQKRKEEMEKKRLEFERQNSFISGVSNSSKPKEDTFVSRKMAIGGKNMFWLNAEETKQEEKKEKKKKKKKEKTTDPMCGKKLFFKMMAAVKFKVFENAKIGSTKESSGFKKLDSSISEEKRKYCCSLCSKVLNNQTEASIIKNCGCCVCQMCCDTFIKKNMTCCGKKILHMSDIIKLEISGSGYSSGKGKNTTTVQKMGFRFA